jgi:hypothetical protein
MDDEELLEAARKNLEQWRSRSRQPFDRYLASC